MRTVNYIAILLLLLIYNSEIHSQYVFRHIDVAEGLSDNQIRYFVLQPDGRLIISTISSLNIYNGVTFEYIYPDKTHRYFWDYNRFLKERYSYREYYDAEGRLWSKSPDYLTLFDMRDNCCIYNIDSVLHSFGIERKIKNMFVDKSKNYWFLTDDDTFSFYDISKKQLKTVESGNSPFVRQYGVPYEMAQYKNLYWIVYSSGLMRCWDSSSEEFIIQDDFLTGKISEASNFFNIIPTSDGNLWIMYNQAVFFYNRTNQNWKAIATISGASNFFTCMDLDKDGNVWVGTSWSGLRRIDADTHKVETVVMQLENGGTMNNDIECVFVDADNGLWVGTLWQGICYYSPNRYKFKLVRTKKMETPTTNESIRCFLEDDDGTILLGTLYDGVLRYNPTTGEIQKAFADIVPEGLIISLYRDREKRLWIGTFLNGFYCLEGKNVRRYNYYTFSEYNFTNQNMSRAIYEDTSGRFWVSVANQGIGELFPETGKITMLRDKHPEIAFHFKTFGFYPVNDNTFAAYGENGIYYYDTQNDSIYFPDNAELNANIIYYCIQKDSKGREWYGTEQGIKIIDRIQSKNYTINTADGLPNNNVFSIEEDNNGAFWVSTINGITRIEIAAGFDVSLANFDNSDGLQSGKFFEGSSLKAKDGCLFFGGYNGFNYFNPDQITYGQTRKRPVFTGLRLFNTPVDEKTEFKGRRILEHPLGNSKEIRLCYNENFITLEFSGLNYVNPSHTYYRYKLENYEQNWNEIATTGLGTATYTGLKPGTYIFKVYTAGSDKVWGDEFAEMRIIISPPVWATMYARIFYFLLLITGVYFIYRYWKKKAKESQAQKRAAESEKQKQELDQMKFRFFTNISHEFRTPLTLIMTPLNTLIQQQKDEQLKQKLDSIYRNAENVFGLINQLLDFRKLEMGGEKLKLSHEDFIDFIKYVYLTFKDTAENKSVKFTFESEIPQWLMWFDKDKIRKIINNLYSNALKFTPTSGLVSTTLTFEENLEREFVKIEVADSGCGITEKEKAMIFDRFYQCENRESDTAGSGIGLHLVKEYAELHGGQIKVSSKINEGSVFTLLIPADLQGEPFSGEQTETSNHPKEMTVAAKNKKLLIVEDNAEFRDFLVEQLSVKFNIIQAADGRQGEATAIKESPDLIVSDLMMPVLNGLEMCEHLKTNIETSHIPIILLTARLSDEAKIESYKAGADSYISKPFNLEVLLARIEMLIEQQEKRKKLFHKTIELTPSSITTTSLDEEFVKKALQSVDKNIENTSYSVENLSSDMALSRSQLYRKLESIMGLSPNEFINSVRMKRAAQLLKDSEYTISEISDRCGFNTIRNFNRLFRDEFGVTPTQYRE
jgi:signal transduction histidine kinase/DNA-binding response OmpR family regulator/ligand-binding sensor domain-containing protein